MLKVSGLSKSYGEQVVFENISFAMSQGERLGLVGRNGTGKTTLFKIVLGEEEQDAGTISMPRYYTIGHLSQHLKFSEGSVLEEAAKNLPNSEDGIDETYKAEAILMGLGLTEEYFSLKPSELSGGYQIRLNLAKVLVSNPSLLLLDEPTNYLDIVSIRWLKKFLQSWRGELMIITHDREFMDSVTTHTMAIHRSKVRKVSGATEKLYAQIIQEEEIYEQTRQNDEKKRVEIEEFINRFRAKATKASAVQSRIKALSKMGRLEKLMDINTLEFEFNSSPFMGKWLIEALDLSFGYAGGLPLINNLSLSVGKKDRVAIIGKNGKGKTTFLNLLAGELAPSTGEVRQHPSLKLAYFGQTNINRLDLKKTIEQEIMEAHPDYSRAAARRICGAMMFDGDKALKKIEILSGGERSRVLLGKLLVSPANMLLLDEPTNHLDMESIDSLVEAINTFDGAVILVTHSELILREVATRLIIFDGGEIRAFEGTYDEFLEKIGWSNEVAESGPAKAKQRINKKEARKLRADLLAEKQKTLGPMQKKMKEIEEEIIRLEQKAEEENRQLLAASQENDPDAIASFSKAYHDSRGKVDQLFDKLEGITAEHDSKVKEFEERFNAIG